MSANDRISFAHDGRRYYWTEKNGFVDEHWQRPPLVIQRVLEGKLNALLAASDVNIKNPHLAVRRAVSAKSHGQYSRTERLARHAVRVDPANERAAAVLSSVLRAQGRAKEALQVTNGFRGSTNAALLTSRAAALLDLGDGVGARRLVRRAWAIAKERGEHTGEISMVFNRLGSRWPELRA
jgi:hypothetical protein